MGSASRECARLAGVGASEEPFSIAELVILFVSVDVDIVLRRALEWAEREESQRAAIGGREPRFWAVSDEEWLDS